MMDYRFKISLILLEVLGESGDNPRIFEEDQNLYEGGIGLDSLDTAAFSVFLEREFGHDPYSEGFFPQTFGEVIAYYKEHPPVR